MNTITTIKKVCIILFILCLSDAAIGQEKTNMEIVKKEFKKFPKSIQNNGNFKKSYLFYLAQEHDSTLLYSSKFLMSRKSMDEYSQFCHYFRGISFEVKELFQEARREFKLLPESFIMFYPAKMKLGGIALELGEYAKALDYLMEIKNLPDEIEFDYDEDRILHDIGNCYLHLDKFEQSEHYLLESLNLQLKKKDTSLLVSSYMDVANLYYVQYKDDQAIPFFEKAYALAKRTNDFTLKQNASLNMAVVEENRKNYVQSIEYRKEYEQWRDSLNDQNKIYEVAQLEKKFITEQKQKEIELLAKDNTIKKAQVNTFIYSSILLLLLTGTLFYFYLSKRKANKLILSQKIELDALNDTKDRLFSVVSHDLRSNVNALDRSNSELSDIASVQDLKELSPQLQRNTNLTASIKGLLDNMLNWALLQTEQMYFQKENIPLAIIVNQTTHNYLPLLESKNISLVTNIPSSIIAFLDIESLKIVLRNALDNAIKFSNSGDQISIYSRNKSSSRFDLVIEDTGVGMSPSTLNQLLKNTKSKSDSINQERTGLGLHLCHAMILKNGGTLNLESEKDVGTKLIITLPLSQDYE